MSTGTAATIHDIEMRSLTGEPVRLSEYAGTVVLAVNVASKCGHTPQYAGLQRLQEAYGQRGFTVLGFPCNQFFGQEPGTSEQIQEFCSLNYGVTFPIFEKLDVKGPGQHRLYRVLTALPDDAGKAGNVSWNFEKFLVGGDGRPVRRFRPKVQPDSPEIVGAIDDLLGT